MRQLLLFSLLFASSLLAVESSPAFAQSSSVHGTVSDATGSPLTNATVILRDSETGLQRYGSATDQRGAFEIERVRPGRYEVRVSHIGYSDHVESVAVTAQSVNLNVVLMDRAVSSDEVVVTGMRARRRLNPVTFSNMTAKDLAEQPSMQDLPVLLATLPSITYHTENGNGIGYSTLRLRGFDQRRIAVSINGIPQNDPEDFNVFWINFFDIQGAVDDVQVQRGAGSALYGTTAIGGAINIVASPYRAAPYAFVETGFGSFSTQRYTVEANTGLLGDRYVAFGRFSRLLTDGYRDWSWSRYYRFFVGFVRYGERSTLTVQGYGGPQRDGLAFSGIPREANERSSGADGQVDRRFNASAATKDQESFHQPHVELFHDYRISSRASLHQALFWVKGEGYFDFGATFRSADYLRLPGGWRDLSSTERSLPLFLTAPDASVLFRAYLDQWQIGWLPRVSVRHRGGETTVAGEARLHRSIRWGRTQQAEGLPEPVVGTDNDFRVYQFRGEKRIASLSISSLLRPIDLLAVQADVQLTHREYHHGDERFFGNQFSVPYTFVNPRLGITFLPERPISFYASVAHASREPRLKSLYDGEEAGAGFRPRFRIKDDGELDYDSPLVVPERSLDVELGVAVRRSRYRANINGFLMLFQDEIVPSGGLDQFGVPRTGNADRTRHVGVEMEGAIRLISRLDLEANATISRNRFVRFSEFIVTPDDGLVAVNRNGNPIAGFPDAMGHVGLRYSIGGLSARLAGMYTGEQNVDNSGGRTPEGVSAPELTVPGSFVLDAGLRFEFGQKSRLLGLELMFDVNNVLNDRVLLYGNAGPLGPQFFPLATRNVYVGMRYTVR